MNEELCWQTAANGTSVSGTPAFGPRCRFSINLPLTYNILTLLSRIPSAVSKLGLLLSCCSPALMVCTKFPSKDFACLYCEFTTTERAKQLAKFLSSNSPPNSNRGFALIFRYFNTQSYPQKLRKSFKCCT